MRTILTTSLRYGWRVPAVRYLMVAGAFSGGVGIYVFYALQPYLLELWGDPNAYGIAGLAATALFVEQVYLGIGIGAMERVAAYTLPIWLIAAGISIMPLARGGST